jgi:uncharacterized protein (DUF4415 family)
MNGKPTKKAASKALGAQQQAELDALAATREEDIDTSDIPEVSDWSGAERGLFYRPIKRQLTLRIDADIIDWFKRRAQGKGYQTNINRALREYVQQRQKQDAARPVRDADG